MPHNIFILCIYIYIEDIHSLFWTPQQSFMISQHKKSRRAQASILASKPNIHRVSPVHFLHWSMKYFGALVPTWIDKQGTGEISRNLGPTL